MPLLELKTRHLVGRQRKGRSANHTVRICAFLEDCRMSNFDGRSPTLIDI